MTCAFVVIGHVDHGKTALVEALTGMATDRLPEEKARNLSILPGFAHHAYSGRVIDFIDAPGHEDFVAAMISGASGAGAALLVVSATEGIGVQTLEHLEIARLLGISRGVVALSKADLVPVPERAALREGLREALSRTVLASAPVVLCSALSGEGLGDVHAAIARVAENHVLSQEKPQQMTLPIDRSFSLTGQGTIVTGTLRGREIAVGDEVCLQPSGRPVILRSLHSRGEARDRVAPGVRVAVNLRGVAVAEIPRGSVLTSAGVASVCVDVVLQASGAKRLRHMQEVRVHFGTSSAVAQVRLFAGEGGFAQFKFQRPVFGVVGQHAVLRQLSPAETIAGAVFLDPQARPTRAGDSARVDVLRSVQLGAPEDIARALSRAGGGVAEVAEIRRLAGGADGTGLGKSFVHLGEQHVASEGDVQACADHILSALASYHSRHPLHAVAPRSVAAQRGYAPLLVAHAEDLLFARGEIRRQGNQLALRAHDPQKQLTAEQQAAVSTIEAAFRDAGLAVSQSEVALFDPDLIAFLTEQGRLIRLQNVALKQTLVFHTDVLRAAAAALSVDFPPPARFSTSQARSTLGTTRRVIVPVLEHFDSTGLTQRIGDARAMTGAIAVPQSVPPC